MRPEEEGKSAEGDNRSSHGRRQPEFTRKATTERVDERCYEGRDFAGEALCHRARKTQICLLPATHSSAEIWCFVQSCWKLNLALITGLHLADIVLLKAARYATL